MKKFKVYQTDADYRFFDFDFAERKGFDFNKDYKEVCQGEYDLDDVDQVLNKVFEDGNVGELRRKNSQNMRSVSVSDIIEVDGMYFYVEGFGFKDVTNYVK